MKKSIALMVLTGTLAASAFSGTARSAPSTPADRPGRKRAQLAGLNEIVKREPSIKEVQQAALAHYQLEPDRIRSMSTSARLKGLFPEIDAGLDSTLGHTFTNTQDALFPTFPFKDRQAGSSDQMVWHVRGVWDFSRVVFNPEQLDIKTLGSLQETLIREVTTMYFSRRRVLAGLIVSPPDDEEERYFEELRLEEMTATIDAFTGGKFADRAWHGESVR